MELDLSNKCRICLTEENEMHYLFNEFDQGITLKEILTSTTNFEVEKDDGFPAYVCQNCTTVMVDFYNLKTVYGENIRQIKTLLDKVDQKSDDENITNIDEISMNVEPIIEDDKQDQADFITIKVESNTDEEDSASDSSSIKHLANSQENNSSIEYEYQEIDTYTCSKCNEQFLQKDDIQTHMMSKHDILITNYDEITQPLSLLKIKKPPEPTKPFKCNVCNKSFLSQQSYKDHQESHKKNVCLVCGVGFIKKSYLKDHQEIHCTEKRHVCNYCNKAFKRRTVLVKHRRIHTHPRQCICEICGKAFNDKGTLKTHIMLLHVKERNYICLICGVKFPLKATLEKHIRRHQNKEREFFCTQCPLGYKDKSSLDRHVFVKHSGQNMKSTCADCGKQYTTLSNLFKHKRICHLRQAAAGVTVENKI